MYGCMNIYGLFEHYGDPCVCSDDEFQTVPKKTKSLKTGWFYVILISKMSQLAGISMIDSSVDYSIIITMMIRIFKQSRNRKKRWFEWCGVSKNDCYDNFLLRRMIMAIRRLLLLKFLLILMMMAYDNNRINSIVYNKSTTDDDNDGDDDDGDGWRFLKRWRINGVVIGDTDYNSPALGTKLSHFVSQGFCKKKRRVNLIKVGILWELS